MSVHVIIPCTLSFWSKCSPEQRQGEVELSLCTPSTVLLTLFYAESGQSGTRLRSRESTRATRVCRDRENSVKGKLVRSHKISSVYGRQYG